MYIDLYLQTSCLQGMYFKIGSVFLSELNIPWNVWWNDIMSGDLLIHNYIYIYYLLFFMLYNLPLCSNYNPLQ